MRCCVARPGSQAEHAAHAAVHLSQPRVETPNPFDLDLDLDLHLRSKVTGVVLALVVQNTSEHTHCEECWRVEIGELESWR